MWISLVRTVLPEDDPETFTMDSRRLNALAAVAMLSAGAFWIGFMLTGHVVALLLGGLTYSAGTGFFVAYVVAVLRDYLSRISFELSVDEGVSRYA